MICVTEADLPGFYQEADAESKAAQRTYMQVFACVLSCTVLGAAAAWCATEYNFAKLRISAISTFLMCVALVLTFIISDRDYEHLWYGGRAIAESVKTRSWSYMMRSEPYTADITDEEADRRLVEDLKTILSENASLVLRKSQNTSVPTITQKMSTVRALTIEDRLETYVQCRIVDQRNWYGAKARKSAQKEQLSFVLMQSCQLISIGIAIFSIFTQHVTSGSVGVLATLSGCILAWLQVKKYQETAQSYSIAYEELGLIEALSHTIRNELELDAFVRDAENAVSREHTLWIAKRMMR